MTFFVTIAGRRWPCEETFKTGKDVLGWDQSQVRTWDGVCRHTALAALAQLRHAAIRNALCGDITLPPPPPAATRGDGARRRRRRRRRSAALTWASPSATRPSPPGPGSPARPHRPSGSTSAVNSDKTGTLTLN